MAKILFVGDMNEWGRTAQRARALIRLGHAVTSVSTVRMPHREGIDGQRLLEKALWKLGIPRDATGANRALKTFPTDAFFDILWADKAMTIKRGTLRVLRRRFPAMAMAWCAEDDMAAPHNQSMWFRRALPLYDVAFTTKTFNVSELMSIGARRVELFLDAYDETLHRPLDLSPEDHARYGCEVGFIGTFEEDRAEQMLFLAEQGIVVTVWGSGWEQWKNKHENLKVKYKPIYGEEYAKAINGTKINLCFLRKINRDEVTSRSVEIPACGAFMLGERTSRHLEFFQENKEASFFSSRKELLEKVRYYLTHDDERRRIAAAGRARCLASGYSMCTQLAYMLTAVDVSSSDDVPSGRL
jgi:hypothetical protein